MLPDQAASQKLVFIGMRGLPPDLPGAGGGERETDAKTRRLAARGRDVTVYCRSTYLKEPLDEYEGVQLVTLPALKKTSLETLSHTLLATLHAIFRRDADVINYHGMGNALYLPLAKIAGKQTVIYMDGIDWERPKWGKAARLMLKWGAAAAFRWGDFVYVDNVVSQKRFGEIFGREPAVITLGADLWDSTGTDELAQFGLTPDGYLLFVGMLRPDKGVHILLEAYRQLDTAVPLVIVGDSPDNPEYVQMLKDMADDRVKFLGYQYGQTARQLFANCMIYVQPSVMEGNSPALMSAMACSRCVVVNGIPQNRETIGDAGVAFEAGNPADLTARLRDLLTDPDCARELGQRARRRIETVYNWERVVDELEAVYDQFD